MISLVKRNISLYLTDKAGVILSLLGAFVAVFLVMGFLRTALVSSLVDGFGGLVTQQEAGHLLDTWLIASASVIASATTGLGAFAFYIRDRESSMWRDFLITPLRRWSITAGYLIAAAIISVFMTFIVYALGTAYCLVTQAPLSWSGVVEGWGWLMLCCLSFTCLMGFVVSLLKTFNAYTALSIIVGVMFGFLAETYVTTAMLRASLADVLAGLPFAQASALVRQPYTSAVIASLPVEAQQATIEAMGISLSVGTTPVTTTWSVITLVGVALMCAVGSWLMMARSVQR